MELYKASRDTIRRAIRLLVADGLVETRQGEGTLLIVRGYGDSPPELRSGSSMYQQITDDLRRTIYSGEVQVGSLLGTQAELMELYKASRDTIRRAIRLLVADGLVETRQGEGTLLIARTKPFATASAGDRLAVGETEHDPSPQHFPKMVGEAMEEYLASIGNQAERNRVEDLLRPLAYARGDGLPLDDDGLWSRLATALAPSGRSYTVGDVATLLHTAADYLIETMVTGQAPYYRLYDQALADRLRERDQRRLRPVSAAQIVYQCLLDTVASYPDGARNWSAAHPYLHRQLAGHATDIGQLSRLVDDPGFLVAADPGGLFAALQRPGQPSTGNAQIYRHAYPHLPSGADMAGERASYLQLAARRQRARLADQLDQLPLHQPWTVRWVRGQRPTPHYIVGRHDNAVSAVVVGERHGRPVIVSSSYDQTVRVWDLESGEPVLGPLTGHDSMGDRGGGRRAARPTGHRLGRRRPHGAGVGPGVRRASARPAHRPRQRGDSRWRSASGTADRSSSPAAARRACGCGTWNRASQCSARSPATTAR